MIICVLHLWDCNVLKIFQFIFRIFLEKHVNNFQMFFWTFGDPKPRTDRPTATKRQMSPFCNCREPFSKTNLAMTSRPTTEKPAQMNANTHERIDTAQSCCDNRFANTKSSIAAEQLTTNHTHTTHTHSNTHTHTLSHAPITISYSILFFPKHDAVERCPIPTENPPHCACGTT